MNRSYHGAVTRREEKGLSQDTIDSEGKGHNLIHLNGMLEKERNAGGNALGVKTVISM